MPREGGKRTIIGAGTRKVIYGVHAVVRCASAHLLAAAALATACRPRLRLLGCRVAAEAAALASHCHGALDAASLLAESAPSLHALPPPQSPRSTSTVQSTKPKHTAHSTHSTPHATHTTAHTPHTPHSTQHTAHAAHEAHVTCSTGHSTPHAARIALNTVRRYVWNLGISDCSVAR